MPLNPNQNLDNPFAIDIPSPCIGVCKIQIGTDYCEGCLRTRHEIREWRDSDNSQRLNILQELKRRRVALGIISTRESKGRRRQS